MTATVGRALVFVAAAGGDQDTVEQPLLGACDAVASRLPAGSVRAGIRLHDDPLAAIARERQLQLVDAVVEVTVPDPGDFDAIGVALAGFAGDLGLAIDAGGTFTVAGPCHLLEPRSGPVMLGSTGRRRDGVSRQEFSHWWLHRHGPMSIDLVPSLGYQQTHVDPDASRLVGDASGIATRDHDLGETAYFPTLEAFIGPMSDPDVGKELFDDEAGFVDHSSITAAMCRLVLERGDVA